MIVAPGTAALAAAMTLDAVPSVRRVSPGPWATVAGFVRAPDRLEAVVLAVLDAGVLPELAAPAMCVPARMPPASRPAPSRPAAPTRFRAGPALLLSFSILNLLLAAAPCAPLQGTIIERVTV